MRILSQLSRRSARREGLTLIEILVASVILIIIVTSLFVVFKAGLDSWRRTQAHLEVFQSARAAFDIMTRDLSAAYLNSANPAITFRGFDNTGLSGWVAPSGGDEVFFVATLNPSLNYSDAVMDLCKVGYYLNNTNNQLMRYFYYVRTGTTPNYDFANTTNVIFSKIASNVTGLTLQYYDANGGPYAVWDSTSAASPPAQLNKKPVKAEITLTVKEPNSAKTQTFTTGICIPQ